MTSAFLQKIGGRYPRKGRQMVTQRVGTWRRRAPSVRLQPRALPRPEPITDSASESPRESQTYSMLLEGTRAGRWKLGKQVMVQVILRPDSAFAHFRDLDICGSGLTQGHALSDLLEAIGGYCDSLLDRQDRLAPELRQDLDTLRSILTQ